MAVGSERKRITKSAGERRQDLLTAAVRVFAEKGVARSTISDISEAAGVAKGTFYLYFSSKEQLLAALKESFVDQILEHAGALYSRVGRDDWWALVDETVTSFFELMTENRDMIHVMVQEGITPETSPQFAECHRRVDEMFATGIKMGVEAGVFQVTDPALTGRFLHHALDGVLAQMMLYEDELDTNRFLAAARELVHKALAP